MANSDVAHMFFYSDFNDNYDKRYMTVSYHNNLYYSYYTVIGAVIQTKDNHNILLVSDSSMSSTTAKHISQLINACPFEWLRVPMKYGNHTFGINTVIQRIIKNLDYYKDSKLTLQNNRLEYINHFNMLIDINNKIQDINIEIINQYKPLFDDLNNSDKVKELKAKQRELNKINQAKIKEELKDLLANNSYYDLILKSQFEVDYALRQRIKKIINPKNDLSFIWFDTDKIKTSQNITVDRKEAESLLKLWNKGKLKHGMTISHYTVLEVMPDYVKIGCHKISTDNLKALLNELEKIERVA